MTKSDAGIYGTFKDMMSELSLRDRKLYETTYERCFIGSEAVDWLVSKLSLSRRDAVAYGRQLMEKHLIENVQAPSNSFEDGFVFYGLTAKGEAVGGKPLKLAPVLAKRSRSRANSDAGETNLVLRPSVEQHMTTEDKEALLEILQALEERRTWLERQTEDDPPSLGSSPSDGSQSARDLHNRKRHTMGQSPMGSRTGRRGSHLTRRRQANASSMVLPSPASTTISMKSAEARLISHETQRGFLEKQSLKDPSMWKKRWIVLSKGKTMYYRDKVTNEAEDLLDGYIPLDVVTSVRTAPEHGPNVFELDAVTRKFVFRAPNGDVMRKWLFAFQCSVANVLAMLLDPEHMDRRRRLRLKKWWKTKHSANEMSPSVQRSSISVPIDVDSECIDGATCGSEAFTCAALASAQGRRPSMEDAHCMVGDLNTSLGLKRMPAHQSFFGIYDGHGGKEASEFVSKQLHINITKKPIFRRNVERAIAQGFDLTDTAFCIRSLREGLRCGTTAVVALIRGEHLTVANCGGQAEVMSHDHKPSRSDETARIRDAGGFVYTHNELNLSRLYRMNATDIRRNIKLARKVEELVGFITISRVQGVLSVSRAIGDVQFKALKNVEFGQEFEDDLVIATPEVIAKELDEQDEFLVMACDGFWDVFDNQEAVDAVRARMLKGLALECITKQLVAKAHKYGSMDNISLLIVQFRDLKGGCTFSKAEAH